LTKRLSPPRTGGKLKPVSAVDYFLALAEAIGCRADSRRLELATVRADESAADALWERLDLAAARRLVLLNAGGAYGSAKHWPREHCVELSRRLAEVGYSVLVLCGPAERAEAAAIARAANHPEVKSMAEGDVGFGVTKAVIRRARLLITTDSGPRHIAAAQGTPTITLFGPIDPRWSENYQPGAIQLRLPLECSPCGKRVCPLGHGRCMQDLSPDAVFEAARRILESSPAQQAA
jgi:heptosyltransferase-2